MKKSVYYSIYWAGTTSMCLPCALPVLYHNITCVHSVDYGKHLLLNLSIEADITRGCF